MQLWLSVRGGLQAPLEAAFVIERSSYPWQLVLGKAAQQRYEHLQNAAACRKSAGTLSFIASSSTHPMVTRAQAHLHRFRKLLAKAVERVVQQSAVRHHRNARLWPPAAAACVEEVLTNLPTGEISQLPKSR